MFTKAIEQLMTERPFNINKIHCTISDAAKLHAPEDLKIIIELSNMRDLFDEIISEPATVALVAWGLPGLEALKTKIIQGRVITGSLSQKLLLMIAGEFELDQSLSRPPNWSTQCGLKNSEELKRSAIRILRELLLAQFDNIELRHNLHWNITLDSFKGSSEKTSTYELFLSMLVDSRLSLNESLLEEFSGLLTANPVREEELHKFLFENPILLDPLALEVRSKHELGSDFITDFVIRRFDNAYIVVEIEKTSDQLFTSSGRMHSQLTDATSQMRDFQTWINSNLAYARTRLPGIRRPEGLVVIGRSNHLNEENKARLEEENYSRRGHIKIVTYDQLFEQAKTVYNNLLDRPLRFQGKRVV